MNPLASTKYAPRLFMALAAIAGILFAAGCGSSNSITPPNQEGFTNASLTGTYVFSSTGLDSGGVFLAVAGAFAANGSGGTSGITGGTIDVNGFDPGFFSTPITSGGYSVGPDGRGQVALNWNGGTITLDFVLTSSVGGPSTVSTHGLITEFDGNGTGSGSLDLQATGALTGSYSFGLAGESSTGTPLAMVGTFNSGAVAAGVPSNGLVDINSGGTSLGGLTGLTLTATVTAGSPGTGSLVASDGTTYNFDVYMVDPTHLKFIETDSAQILAGDAFTQQSSIPLGVYAYAMEGLDPSDNPMALGGFISSDGTSIISGGLEDYNDAGTVNEVTGFGGSFTAFSGGRTELTLNGIYNGVSGSNVTFAAYPSSGGIELLEIDGGGITGGFTLPQGSTTALAAQGYGLNLSASNAGGFEEDDIAQFMVTSSNTYNGAEDINDEGLTTSDAAFNGTLTPDTVVAGHGSAASTSGEINFNYYIAGPSVLILETDNNQVGVGSFEVQTSTQAAAVARSNFLPVRMKPGAKAKAGWKKKQ
ncbi:MAG: hypothetical protein WCC04_08665 [Terriglobales bacterium]